MPDLQVGDRRWSVAPGTNLLDALNDAGLSVPYSCRAGSCHACMVRCVSGEPLDAEPEALDSTRRGQGWRLSCQCRVVDDLTVEVFDPVRDGLPATVVGADWLSPSVLRLRLDPERPLRYRVGQHLVLWTESGVARPYSLASVPGDDPFLEFHVDCQRPGAFADVARTLKNGDPVRLGELQGGSLRYDPDWQDRPLWLLAAGTGLAPLWGVLREALRQDHQGDIRVLHLARDAQEHYLTGPLSELAARHSNISVEPIELSAFAAVLSGLRVTSRQTIALVCGSPTSVEAFSKRLFITGLPRGQVLSDEFVERG
ncbi:NAD(P)H-flavin reductase [Pseudomonas graminis]|uniref:iron-sulfur-binding ferredoxin reductase n=1 Tax=Pseudomonas graminis TaxID=158627 RepID=UPI00105BA19B|nr:iron-sulfur-binding ferredoxin reductase [Pseudomonas graminis]TDV55769.1 NAD(P)H-flavin reductase [Pseudomonas graminis]